MNILVTGASQGIGREIVLELTKNKENTVYALARNAVKINELATISEVQNGFSNLVPVCFDLNEIIHGIFPDAFKNATEFDVIIHAAGVLLNKKFDQISFEEIENTLVVNFIAPALLTQFLLPKIKRNGQAHVVFIGSMGGFQGSVKFPGLSLYSASKAALGNLAETLATEYAGSGIAFNCLALGAVNTQMLQLAFPGYQATTQPNEMAKFIANFALTGQQFFNGKILPVANTTP